MNGTMARKVQVRLLDDIDGNEAEETVRFGLDGTEYEIDLCAKHAEKLRAALAKFILASRRQARRRVTVARGRGGTATVDRPQNAAVRGWARSKGIGVAGRRRVAAHM